MNYTRYISRLDSYSHYYMLSKALDSEHYNSNWELYNKIKKNKDKITDIAPVNFYKEYNKSVERNIFKNLEVEDEYLIRELACYVGSDNYTFNTFKSEEDKYQTEVEEREAMPIEEYIDKNKSLFDKKFIITQDGISLPLYFKKDWDYEVLNADTDGQHSITITVSPDNQTKTIVIGRYFSTEVNAVLQDLITFIYSEKEYVFQMPINDIIRDEDSTEDTSKLIKCIQQRDIAKVIDDTEL